MENKLNLTDAVTDAILQSLKEEGCIYKINVDPPASLVFNKSLKDRAIDLLIKRYKMNSISLHDETVARNDTDTKMKTFFSGAISNELRKNKKFNMGNSYGDVRLNFESKSKAEEKVADYINSNDQINFAELFKDLNDIVVYEKRTEEETPLQKQLRCYRELVLIRNQMSIIDPRGKYKNAAGGIGEFIAEQIYGFSRTNGKGYDAIDVNGKKIEVKTRTNKTGKVEIKDDAEADLLLVIYLSDSGDYEEVFFGPMSVFKMHGKYNERTKDRQLSIKKLELLAKELKHAA